MRRRLLNKRRELMKKEGLLDLFWCEGDQSVEETSQRVTSSLNQKMKLNKDRSRRERSDAKEKESRNMGNFSPVKNPKCPSRVEKPLSFERLKPAGTFQLHSHHHP